ncbi:hypothetical protein EON65_30290 [archaeon]|nr:MAG: hypothetical protein EON65_30290 [archaeon]
MAHPTYTFFAAVRELRALSTKQFAVPGDPNGWPLGGMFPFPQSKAEGGEFIQRGFMHISIPILIPISTCLAFPRNPLSSTCMCDADMFRAYFKQAREELALRLADRLFDADGTKNKWWQVTHTIYSSISCIYCMYVYGVFYSTYMYGRHTCGLYFMHDPYSMLTIACMYCMCYSRSPRRSSWARS